MKYHDKINYENTLPDEAITDLYWSRNESTITETDKKYGKYRFTINRAFLQQIPTKKAGRISVLLEFIKARRGLPFLRI